MLYTVFILSSIFLLIYAINIMILSFVFIIRKYFNHNYTKTVLFNTQNKDKIPFVTTQVAVYNEKDVIFETIQEITNIDYPKDKHQIQIIDDSDDGSSSDIANLVKELQMQGIDIQHLTRLHRYGYKAGALNEAMKHVEGEYILVLDADFRPKPDIYKALLPSLLEDKDLAYIQARWGHRNYSSNLLTKIQSMAIDGHFIVEQYARNQLNFVSHFNGTAGIWRKKAIEQAGLWPTDLLSEDVGISYEARMKGWRSKYTNEYIIEGEIPNSLLSYKIQQSRWATGTVQAARKYLFRVFNSKERLGTKIQAFFHMTQYFINFFILLNVLCIFMLFINDGDINNSFITLGSVFLGISLLGPVMLYLCAYYFEQRRLKDFMFQIGPFFALCGGMVVSNSIAVVKGLFFYNLEFIRTPKTENNERKTTSFKLYNGFTLEVLWALVCIYNAYHAIQCERLILSYFMASYFISMTVVIWKSLNDSN